MAGYQNPLNALEKLAEGRYSKLDEKIKSYIKEPLPTFRRMIVLDVISDPTIIDKNKLDYWEKVLKVTNFRFAKVLPRNSIIAQPAHVGSTRISPIMFLFPFFPSHLALPCKPGEMVWMMYENPNAAVLEMGYWFCRIAEPHTIDDVNHTHHAGQLDHSMNPGIKKSMEGELESNYEMRNGKTVTTKSGVKSTIKNSDILKSPDEEVFEKLITETDAAGLMSYESIPRFKKRPGDVALEGSNNTLIVLGTDRINTIGDYHLDASHPDRGIRPFIEKDFTKSAGSIDLVAGRGMTPMTGGLSAITKRIIDGSELKKEIQKQLDFISPEEGDPDLNQDRSRILISQRTLTDRNFGLQNYFSKRINEVSDSSFGDASVVIKSDKVRIIARSDISFIVTNFSTTTKEDIPIKLEESDDSRWASITIKKNGDIVFTPGNNGLIKLGGDDADRAILCTARRAEIQNVEIKETTNNVKMNFTRVKSKPIATDAGGFLGTAFDNRDVEAEKLQAMPDLGTFSTKVLIK